MTTTIAVPLPPWLEEHCFRLEETDSQIRNLNLNIRHLNLEMMQALCKALLANSRIEIINLTSSFLNHAHDPNILVALAQVLARNHPSLRIIHLSYNRLQHVHALGAALKTNTQLHELHLDHNQLENQSAIALAHGLSHNSSIRLLNLNSNRIGDTGGQALAWALQSNSTLRTLELSRNPSMGDATGRALAKAIIEDGNVTLQHLLLDSNPQMMQYNGILQYYVRANQAGRYLLLRQSSDAMNDEQHPLHDCLWRLWPLVLQGLEPDMIYFFLRETPDLAP